MPRSKRRPLVDVRDDALIASINESLEEAQRLAGDRLACRVGCTECCIGPFPISLLDARRLRRGLVQLDGLDPNRAQRVRDRARATAQVLLNDFPGDESTGILWDDEVAEEEFAARHAALPCPALDPLTGACDMYAWRPINCRTFGPPVVFAQEAMPPCRLCFQDSTDDEIAGCVVEMDPDGLEERLVLEVESLEAKSGQTVIALVLAT